MKLSPRDILKILKLFAVAGKDDLVRSIDQLAVFHPQPTNTLVAFRFHRRRFYILVDIDAEDDAAYITEQIEHANLAAYGELVENPAKAGSLYGGSFKGKDVYLFSVTALKKRLDIILAERYPDISRTTWQKYIKAGYVTVNGDSARSSKQEVSDSEEIAVSLPEAADFSEFQLPILYLDDNVIVINKPAGVLTHAKGNLNDEFTVADFFKRYSTYHHDTNRPGIVHRLDRDTSGVLIGARNPETATSLVKQFGDRKVKKTYLAILDGTLKLPEAKIELPIGRHPAAPSTFRVDSKGRAAMTEYTVLAEKNGQSLVELRPLTGRTHQLRVHMAYLGAPIRGDRVYGKAADRLYLHAEQLELTIPPGERKIFTAPVPPAFLAKFPER